jgi:hypothetical protein
MMRRSQVLTSLSTVSSTNYTSLSSTAFSSPSQHTTRKINTQSKASSSVLLSSDAPTATSSVAGTSNVSPTIASKVGMNLHLQPNHPLNIIKKQIESYFHTNFKNEAGQPLFKVFDNIPVSKLSFTLCKLSNSQM